MKTREELEAMSAEELGDYLCEETGKLFDDINEDMDRMVTIQKWTTRAWAISMGILTVIALIAQRKSYRNGLNTGYTMGKNDGVMAGYKDAMKIMRWRS